MALMLMALMWMALMWIARTRRCDDARVSGASAMSNEDFEPVRQTARNLHKVIKVH